MGSERQGGGAEIPRTAGRREGRGHHSGPPEPARSNNAAQVANAAPPGRFWEQPLNAADVITVGLRSHCVASFHVKRVA